MDLPEFFNGVGGTVHGSFFRVADQVDTSKPPGTTSLDRLGSPSTFGQAFKGTITGHDFVYSPHLTWFLLACGVWWIAPYRLQDSIQDVVKQRLIVNHIVVFTYVGFWHAACYWWHLAKRPFSPNSSYSYSNAIHNIFYTWLGVLQWTLTEVAFLYCYQTHRIPCQLVKEGQSSASATSWLQTAIFILLVPTFRDVHFYFSHRFLHARFLYKYIHSLHHRNTADIEPFSGLCMHPVEHLYYFTCYAPCLFGGIHPFILFWMGTHTLISPAAAHSGFEDHFSADLFHYLHHRHTDCNFGGAPLLDIVFGSYRDRGNTQKTTASKDYQNCKATLGFVPENAAFQWLCLGLVIAVGWCYYDSIYNNEKTESSMMNPHAMAFILSTGPAWMALGLSLASNQGTLASLWGDSENKGGKELFSSIFHMTMGALLGVLPSTYLMFLVFGPPPSQ